jgi:transcription elongation factor Elf1
MYCSGLCKTTAKKQRSKLQITERTGKALTCHYCGKEFFPWPSGLHRYNKGLAVHCSLSCSAKSNNAKRSEQMHKIEHYSILSDFEPWSNNDPTNFPALNNPF